MPSKLTVGGLLLLLTVIVWVWIELSAETARLPAEHASPGIESAGSVESAPAASDEHRSPLSLPLTLALAESRELSGDEEDFDALIETLVKITLEASEAAKRGDSARVRQLDVDGREVLSLILLHVEDPEEAAVHKLTGLSPDASTERDIARRMLCLGVLKEGLARRYRAFEHGGSRRQSDQIVAGVLACIPQDEVLAGELSQVLSDAPYLGVIHESTVLDLCALAAEEQHLIPLVTTLLETLWHNLCSEGARTSAELVHLALLFRADTNPAKRLAALRHLLVVDDGRYRELAMGEVIAARDDALTEELTMTVATKLPPKAAAVTLEKLSLVSTKSLMTAFLTLGTRDAGVLAETYERKLADGTRADFRAELVTGVGFQGGAEGMAVASLAFGTDPDPEVRSRAMFILTAHGDEVEAERVLTAAIADPAFHTQPARLGQIVLALENLAATANPNVVDRIGRGIQSSGQLLPGDRARLELVLDRTLPKAEATPKLPGRIGR